MLREEQGDLVMSSALGAQFFGPMDQALTLELESDEISGPADVGVGVHDASSNWRTSLR